MRRLRRAAVALTVVLATALGGTAAYATLSGSVPAKDAQDRLVVRGGVVRLGTKVYLHTNAAHGAIGITRITLVKGCTLRLVFDRKPGEKIVAAIAEEDETVSRLGVQAGISGGVSDAKISLYRHGRRVCANDRMFGNRSNLWISLTYLAPKAVTPAPATTTPTPAPTTSSPTTATPSTPAPTTTSPSTPAPVPSTTGPSPQVASSAGTAAP